MEKGKRATIVTSCGRMSHGIGSRFKAEGPRIAVAGQRQSGIYGGFLMLGDGTFENGV